jgi:glycosyltransferase involved in cell wall biosynthesis
MTTDRPIRVLHSVGSLNRGGIETWLMNVIRQKHPDLKIDFILGAQPGESGDYEREALELGCKIYHHPPSTRLAKRLRILGLASTPRTLENILISEGYDVLHVHGTEFNGDTVKKAWSCGTVVRVAHCHHTQIARGKGGPEMWVRRLRYFTLDRSRTMRYATDLVACGRDAGRLMVGARWDTDPRCKVIYCGVTLAAFDKALMQSSRSTMLERYALPSNALVVGHAGSMGPSPVKNHLFLVRSFAELAKRDHRYHLFMAGDGPLRSIIQAEVAKLGISNRVRMPGLLSDIPEHMTHLFNVHALPSLAEGLPVVAIEAAAAGLYGVLSDRITSELAEHLPGRIEQLSLHAPLADWADALERGMARREPPPLGISRVRSTPLSIEKSVDDLICMYRSTLKSQSHSTPCSE